jgi:16S rRNA (cytosine967-C5)-methyltransferase
MTMPVSRARSAAFDVLQRVERTEAYASELLHSQRYEQLPPADHALLVELVMGVLRWRSVLDDAIASNSSIPVNKMDREVRTALRLGAYQLRCLDRVPAYAAISESVELVKAARKRSAAPLVNAVLRKLAADAKPAAEMLTARDVSELARASAHPVWLVERWWKQYGGHTAVAICQYDQQHPVPAIRLRSPQAGEQLVAAGVKLAPGLLLRDARRVVSGDVTHTTAFRDGEVAIQDEASQLVAALVPPGKRMLDCCAAPGGKTSLLADLSPNSKIIAAELHPHRARLLRRLVRDPNVQVVANDIIRPCWNIKFDAVLADVPCSGTGTLARNPEIKWRLQPEDLTDLHRRQVSILRSAMEQLAPGGIVVYSTCSLEAEENEQVVEVTLEGHPGAQLISCRERLTELREDGSWVWSDLDAITRGPFLRTLPGPQPCDGFFAALIRKQS